MKIISPLLTNRQTWERIKKMKTYRRRHQLRAKQAGASQDCYSFYLFFRPKSHPPPNQQTDLGANKKDENLQTKASAARKASRCQPRLLQFLSFLFALKPPYFCSIDQEPLKKPFLKVSLLQLKNQVNPYRKQLSQFLAFLLLGLFVNAMVIEGLHHHNSQDQFSSCKSALDKTQGDTQLHSAKVNCKLCEVIKHQSQFYNLPSVVSPVLAPVETAKPVFSYLPPHPTAYILAAANKGPPSNLA